MALDTRDLLRMNRRELLAALRAGHPIDPRALDDTEYRGISLGLPHWVERLTWKKFTKVFCREPATGVLRGWNVRIVQTPLDDPAWTPMKRNGRSVTFGHYRVVGTEGLRMPRGTDRGLLIDYGQGGNRWFDGVRWLRDPIVALDAGDPSRLLGWSYLDLGIVRIGTPSFFVLERNGPLGERVAPPRSRT